jgi:putative phosphoesterase
MAATTIGVISDTHGLLRPDVAQAFQGCELIVHAGDVGRPEVLSDLSALAPVIAVRGNIDRDDWAGQLPETAAVPIGDLYLYMIHDVKQLDIDPAASGFSGVISGHSHRPLIERRGGLLYLNPGSAGPRRFALPVTVARLYLRLGNDLEAELVELSGD